VLTNQVKACTPTGSSQHTTPKYKWFDGNFDAMRGYIESVDWNRLLCNNPSAESLWASFTDVLWSAVSMFVPVYSNRRNTTSNIRKRYPVVLRRLMTKKLSLWRQHKRKPFDTVLHSKYRQCEVLCRQAIHNHENSAESRIVDSNNLGTFYRYINKHMSHRSGVSVLRDHDGTIVFDDREKAEKFNKYSAFTH